MWEPSKNSFEAAPEYRRQEWRKLCVTRNVARTSHDFGIMLSFAHRLASSVCQAGCSIIVQRALGVPRRTIDGARSL